MDTSTILNLLQEVFAATLGIDAVAINRDTTATDVNGWDSVAHVLLITAVEKKFSLRFKSREIAGFNSVGNMLDAIEKKINEKQSS